MKLFLKRQHLEELCRHFMPFMIKVIKARLNNNRGAEREFDLIVCLSILEDMELLFARKKLTRQQKFTIKLKKSEAVILWELMMKFPLDAEDFWRINLRNNITEQLYQQLNKPEILMT